MIWLIWAFFLFSFLFHIEKFKTLRPEETVDDNSQDIGAI